MSEAKRIDRVPPELTERRAGPFVWAALWDWLLIGLGFAIGFAIPGWWSWIVAVVFIGIGQHSLSALGHEGSHGLIHPKRWVNDLLVNILCWYPLGVTMDGYRRWHFRHHRHLGTEHDAELETRTGRIYELPVTRWRIVRVFALDLLGGGLLDVLHQIKVLRPKQVASHAGKLAFWAIVIAGSVSLGYWQIPVMWFTAEFTVQWAVLRVRMWFQHTATSGTHALTASGLSRLVFFPHNSEYHDVHHEHPNIPFYLLPQASTIVRAEAPAPNALELIGRIEQLSTTYQVENTPDYASSQSR